MNDLFFIAETPRAGQFGHRFIIPAGMSLDDGIIESVFNHESRNPTGPDYISSSRQVKQELPNGAIRTGNEKLILAGVDSRSLSAEQQRQLHEFLESKLDELGVLVTEKIDWDIKGKRTIVPQDALNRWKTELPFPITAVALKSGNSGQASRKTLIIGALLGGLTGAGLLFLINRMLG